jgi:hypothetical protein
MEIMMAKKYSLTPEHRAQFAPWAQRWIANAMSTKAMDDEDRAAMRAAIKGLYEAANLEPPPPNRVVFVPSPLVGNIAAGFAAAIWWLRDNATLAATRDATMAATRDATGDATLAATRDATADATEAATEAATRDATMAATWAATGAATAAATRDATLAATRDATLAATRDATGAATRAATAAATEVATRDGEQAGWAVNVAVSFSRRHFLFLLKCAQSSWRMRNPGNHWSGWVAYLSFFRHVAKLDLPIYDRFRHYEAATIHGSWRWMHPKFCIVSDRPASIKIDHLRRPHCEDGPSHEWRDGWRLYHWHGQRVDPDIIERRHEITPTMIRAEKNAEMRRVLTEIYAHVHGPGKIIQDMGAKLLSEDTAQDRPRRLYEVDGGRFIHVINGSLEPDGSRREFFLGADPDARTPHDAIAASYGRPARRYREAVRT